VVMSMTGFGRGKKTGKFGKVIADVKSVNHRSFDLTCKLPENFYIFEPGIRQLVSGRVRRGKVNVFIGYEGNLGQRTMVSCNEELARQYYRKLQTLRRKLGIKEDVSLGQIAGMSGVLTIQTGKGETAERMWPEVRNAVEVAVDKMLKMRATEGRFMEKELLKRADNIEKALRRVKRRIPAVMKKYRRQLTRKIRAAGEDNETRIETEAGIFAQNSDITEEVVRIFSHIANFRKALKKGGEIGKKLVFIVQELHREANTAGAKVPDFEISRHVVEIKNEIEKIRELAQNLE
jgi:uncharacterized protein (TIGR00255 family)